MLFDNENFLAERARSGDEKAFEALYWRHQKKVGNVIRRYVKNQQDIDDLVQMVFLKAYQGLKNFRGEAEFFYVAIFNCQQLHKKLFEKIAGQWLF